MKTIIKIIKSGESGQAIIMAMILLVVGSLVLVTLLVFMQSGMNSGQVVEEKVDKLYAADAGVEEAVWQIKNLGEPGAIPLEELDEVYEYYDYTIEGRALPNVNGIDVNVRIERIEDINGGVFRVLSTAGDTRVEAIITSIWLDHSGITDNVITSIEGYTILGPSSIIPGEGEEHGPVDYYDGAWPTAEGLAGWYSMFVDKSTPYPDDELLLTGDDTSIGPEYIDSDFYIHSNNNQNETLALDSTLYITGQATFAGPKDFTIDLNGHTIFIESDVTGGGTSGTALWIAGNVTLTGSGCIIAVGDINFEPQMNSNPDDYILVLSVEGQTWMHPNGDFYGTLAGNSEVSIQNGDLFWSDPDNVDGGLNFPGSEGSDIIWGIHSWEISQINT